MSGTYVVREVRESDLPTLVTIEKERWTREGTEILGFETLHEWFKNQSPFFLVAERDGRIDGFYYAIQVHFTPSEVERHAGEDAQTHRGWSTHAHDPSATSVYGVNIVQRATEAGIALNTALHQRIKNQGMLYFIGIPRLVNLDLYLRGIERRNGGTLPYTESDIALWYAHESMKLLGQTRIWQECTPQPTLALPPLRRPDTLLKFSVAGISAGLLRIVPNLMKDPKSRGYGAFLVSDLT